MICQVTFSEYSENWFKENSVGWCYAYFCTLKGCIKNLNYFIGNKILSDIKPIDITNIIFALAKKNPYTGKPTSRKTLQTIVKTAYRIFDSAIDEDLIYKNPAKDKIKIIPRNAPKKEVKPIPKEIQKLILVTPHRCQLGAMIMMLMGLRRGELIALEWSDFDFSKNVLHICKHAVQISPNEFQVYSGTKNGESRYVNIPDTLETILINEYKKTKVKLVFSKLDGTLHTPSSFKSAWNSYLNTLNYANRSNTRISKYDPKGYPKSISINVHQLRHTYATLLYLSGTDVLTASKLMGHKSVQLTLDIYTHLDEEYKTLDISNFNHYIASVY